MALNSRSVIHPRWTSHSLNVEAGTMLAEVQIFDPEIGSSVYDEITNTWDTTRTILWAGPARVQPFGRGRDVSGSMNPSDIGDVNIHLGAIGTIDLRPGHQIFVTSCATNPQLVNFIYTIKSVVNSSNAWNRVVLCEVDQEVRRNV